MSSSSPTDDLYTDLVYLSKVRFKNPKDEPIVVYLKGWRLPANELAYIELRMSFDPGEVTSWIDPEDPNVPGFLKKGMVPVEFPTAFEHIVRDEEF